MIGKEDKKISITKFRGLYDRGSSDEVLPEFAQDLLNCTFVSDARFTTRSGTSKAFNAFHGTGIKRFFSATTLPMNYNEPTVVPPGITDGAGLLILDTTGAMYNGNSSAPIKTFQSGLDFCALNIGNRTLISPNNGVNGYQQGRLQIYDQATGIIRDAAGLAPAQTAGAGMFADNSPTAGNVALGVHKFAVVFETNTGFWTPVGPKAIMTGATITASASHLAPTIINLTGHNCETGESHNIYGATGTLGYYINDVWHVTKIDDNHFSIPVDTFGISTSGQTVTVYAGFMPAVMPGTGADGTHAVDIGGIPTGPSNTTKRLLLATRANEEEYFFIPDKPGFNSILSDNTTISATVNFDDTELISSADYLFDVLEVVPGGGGICKYAGRVVIAGPYFPGENERVILSNINDPETFNYVSGYIQVQTERDGNAVAGCFVLRSNLYITKFTGTFSAQDNGNDPSTWPVVVIDSVIGAYNYGLSTFTVSQPNPDTGDIILIANRTGLFMFDGVMRRPELSWNIQHLWLRINFEAFANVTVSHDPWNHLIYVACPLDNALDANTLLVCDYSDGRTYDVVRWSVFSFPWTLTSIGMLYWESSIFSPQIYTLLMASKAQNYVWALDPTKANDDGTKIYSYYVPGPVTFGPGGLNFFKLLNFRGWGQGKFILTLAQEDGQGAYQPPNLTLTPTPGRELQRQINFINEKMSVKFASGNTTGAMNDYAVVDRLDVWGLTRWDLRPSV